MNEWASLWTDLEILESCSIVGWVFFLKRFWHLGAFSLISSASKGASFSCVNPVAIHTDHSLFQGLAQDFSIWGLWVDFRGSANLDGKKLYFYFH